MQVTVVLFGNLTRLLAEGSDGRVHVDAAEGSSAAQVLDELAVPVEARGYLVVDGEHVKADHRLHDGAELRVVVPLGGG